MPKLPVSPTEDEEFDLGDLRHSVQDKRTPLKRNILFVGLALLLPAILLVNSVLNNESPKASIQRVWQKVADQNQAVELPPCDKTFLFVHAGYRGFGSNFGLYLRWAMWAEAHNYALLVTSTHDWVYGTLDRYIESPALTCQPAKDAYDYESSDKTWVGQPGWENASHLVTARNDYVLADRWIIDQYIDMEAYAKLPPLDPSVPLPSNETLPPQVWKVYLEEHRVFQKLWKPVKKIQTMAQKLRQQLGLGDASKPRGHVIGVHYRGGDKFNIECLQDNNCGNATIYLEAALEANYKLGKPSCLDCKPTLALMTVEPDAYELFASDSLAEHFDLRLLPPSDLGLLGHDQLTFNNWTLEDRVTDTMTFLRDLTVLSVDADAFIITGSSNVGIMAMLLGGPTKLFRSIDNPFQPTTRWMWWYLQHPTDDEKRQVHTPGRMRTRTRSRLRSGH